MECGGWEQQQILLYLLPESDWVNRLWVKWVCLLLSFGFWTHSSCHCYHWCQWWLPTALSQPYLFATHTWISDTTVCGHVALLVQTLDFFFFFTRNKNAWIIKGNISGSSGSFLSLVFESLMVFLACNAKSANNFFTLPVYYSFAKEIWITELVG